MRIFVLTYLRRGLASRCLAVLHDNPAIDVVQVILARRVAGSPYRQICRKAEKVLHLGPLGTLNGIRLRRWYADTQAEDVGVVCKRLGIAFTETNSVNSEQTIDLVRAACANLGLSLGTGYIAPAVFSIPAYGMLNVHTELLPRFQGAQAIIWPIYEGLNETGFTIHQITRAIDQGDILYRESYPIRFARALRDTVARNLEDTRARVPKALAYVCENYPELRRKAVPQQAGPGQRYTTPTFWEFLRMARRNRQMYRARRVASNAAGYSADDTWG
jgi:methionyl-tRNA formyltransferase